MVQRACRIIVNGIKDLYVKVDEVYVIQNNGDIMGELCLRMDKQLCNRGRGQFGMTPLVRNPK